MSQASPSPDSSDERASDFKLTIELSVGYQRRRSVLGGSLEGHAVTIGLLVGGLIVVCLVVWALFQLVTRLPF